METLVVVLLVAALVIFLVGALEWVVPTIRMIALGLALVTAALLLPAIVAMS